MPRTTLSLTILGALLLSSLLAAQSALFQSMNLASGLVGWWKLCGDTSASSGCAASSSTAVYDSSGNGNGGLWSGTAGGSTGYYSAGYVGPWAGYFDGSTDYVSIANNSALSLSGNLTVSAWINPTVTGLSQWRAITEKRQSGQTNYGLAISNAPSSGYLSFIGGGTYVSTYAPPVGSWTFVTATVASGALTLYANGNVVYTASNITLSTNSAPLYIGWSSAAADEFKGRIDDVRVYNRALSAAEIAQMYLAHN